MKNLEKEIRQGIERIYENPRKMKKLQDERKKLLSHLEKMRVKKQKKLGLKIIQLQSNGVVQGGFMFEGKTNEQLAKSSRKLQENILGTGGSCVYRSRKKKIKGNKKTKTLSCDKKIKTKTK